MRKKKSQRVMEENEEKEETVYSILGNHFV